MPFTEIHFRQRLLWLSVAKLHQIKSIANKKRSEQYRNNLNLTFLNLVSVNVEMRINYDICICLVSDIDIEKPRY